MVKFIILISIFLLCSCSSSEELNMYTIRILDCDTGKFSVITMVSSYQPYRLHHKSNYEDAISINGRTIHNVCHMEILNKQKINIKKQPQTEWLKHKW